MNLVVLEGRLTKDIELRYTTSNKAVATGTIAVNRDFKSQTGEREADFINFVVWGKNAKNISAWVKKGGRLNLVGRMQTRSYDNQQGQKVYVTEVIVSNFYPLSSRPQERQEQDFENIGQESPFGQQVPNFSNNFGGSPFGEGSAMDLSDDDLPF